MTTNRIPEFTDHDGAILVMLGDSRETTWLYLHRRLSDRAGNGATCAACGYRFGKHDPQRVPMYDSIPLHEAVDLFERKVYCQPCTDAMSSANGSNNYWLTGQYANRTAPTTRKVKHVGIHR